MTTYSYVIASIMPDPTRGESLNVGIIVRTNDTNYCRFITDTSRITGAFPFVTDALVRQSVSGVEQRVRESTATDMISLADDVLPASTSGLRASPVRVGLTNEPHLIVHKLFCENVG